jgi:hypothetical protein
MRKQISVKPIQCVCGFFFCGGPVYELLMTPKDQVRAILTLPEWKQERLAEELDVAQSSVHRWLAGAEPRGDKRDQIADLFERLFGSKPSAPRRPKTATIVGRAGAATDGRVLYAEGSGGFGEVLLPEGADEGSVAIEIEGYSMGLIAHGALVFYSEHHAAPTDDMLGTIVIVGLMSGEVLLKRLLRGSQPGLFDLESINGPMLRDQRVQWAAHVDSLVPPWRAKRLRVEAFEVGI